jgi:flagellin
MGRINTNVQSLIAQRVLSQNNLYLNGALERLSTGLRINRGKDDPAGLIASENLRSEQKALNQAVGNADRADQVMNIAEGGLQEVSSLLEELQGLVTASASDAGLSLEEKRANQLQIDSILQTIDRVASSTNFQGLKLLNGNFDFQTTGIVNGVSDIRVNAAKFSAATLGVDIQVTTSAQQAGLFLSMGATGGALDLGTGSTLVFEVVGSKGSREFSFSSGTTLAKVVDAINTFKDVTGVTATASGTGIKIISREYGLSEYVTVKVSDDGGISTGQRGIYKLNGTNFNAASTAAPDRTLFSATTIVNGVLDLGQDVGATINGIRATAAGRTIRVNSDFLDVEVTLGVATGANKAQTLGNVGGSGGQSAFSITGGGADFQLAAKVDITGKVSIGIQDVAVRKLGNSTVGWLDRLASGKANNVVDGVLTDAQSIVAEAIKQVSGLRGRLGAFQKNVVGATIRSLGVAIENTAAAQSVIRDADFASETAQLTRSQILVNASTNILSLANQQPQSALQLLG